MSAAGYAVVRVGAHEIAIANEHVVQALPRPGRPTTLPRRSNALDGVLTHRGRAVPLLRLGRWLELGTRGPAADEHVLLLRADGRQIGIFVDALLGLRRAGPDALQRLCQDDRPEELFDAVLAGDPATPVLEPTRLMALAHAWTAERALALPEDDTRPAGRVDAGGRVEVASLRVGDQLVGLRADDVAEVLPAPALQPGLPAAARARGLCAWRGRTLPVIDPTALVGAVAGPLPWLCVLRQHDLALGVLVSEVQALHRVDPREAAPAAGMPSELVSGAVAVAPGRVLLLLDTARLFAHCPEAVLSALPAQRAGSAARHDGEAFVVFDAGAPFASPAGGLREVIALAPDVAERVDEGLATSVEWRGHAVPVLDLRRAGVPSTAAMRPRQLAVLETGGRFVAIAIERMRSLVAAAAATRTRIPAPGGTRFEMLTVRDEGRLVSYAVLDLAALAASAPAR